MTPARRDGLVLAALILLADQLAKAWIVHGVHLDEKLMIALTPWLNLTWVENRGISMGLFNIGDAGRWPITVLTGAIALAVGFWLARERNRPDALALGAILGGALGNIVDRVRLGYVVDFVHLHAGYRSFYVFNLADAAITLGVVALLLRGALKPQPRPSGNPTV